MANPTHYHGDLKEALVDAATAIIAEQGLAALTLRGAARRAGVSHAAPAHHVGDLAGLLAAIAIRGHRRLAELMAQAVVGAETKPPGWALGQGIKAYVEFAEKSPELAGPMLRRELWAAHAEPVDAELLRGYQGLKAQVLTEQARGWRPELDPDAATQAVWALAQGIVSLGQQGALKDVEVDLSSVLALVSVG